MTQKKTQSNTPAGTSRRQFIKSSSLLAAGAVAVPYFAWNSRSLGSMYRDDKQAIGLIGAGGMGQGNMNAAANWLNVVAIADADKRKQAEANEKLSGGKADLYDDYREILEREDIKIVHIATPDHWHTKPVIEAMLAGKDIYCEKPLTLTIDEGKMIRKVQQETGRIIQVGTQQRSTFNRFTRAMAIVAEGRIGQIQKMRASIGGAPVSESIPVAEVPEGLDWDRWLGPAASCDYRYLKGEGRKKNTNCHYEFRWWYEYSGGKLTDWGAHHVDIAMWALACNGRNWENVSLSGMAEHPVEYVDGVPQQNDRYNTSNNFEINCNFDNGVELVIASGGRNGVLIEGDKGRIFVSRGNLTGAPVEALEENPLPEDAVSKVYKGHPMEENERKAHWLNFLHCHREGLEPISDVHSHMEALNICHLAGIFARLGRDMKWDNNAGEIVGDDVANSMLSRPYREGYEIEMGAAVG